MQTPRNHGKMNVNQLIRAVKSHLCELNYSLSSQQTYGSIFNRFVEYCQERGIKRYSVKVGRDFVWERLGMVLGERDRSQAVCRAMHMLTDYQRYGMIFKKHNIRLEGFSSDYEPLFKSYLSKIEKRGIAASSVRKYRNFLFRFEHFLQIRGVERFGDLELHHVNAYVESHAGLSQNTVSAALLNLRRIMDFAKENAYHHTSFS